MVTKSYNQPLSANDMPRFAGRGTMFRLPVCPIGTDLDIAIVGVPLDVGTGNRPGARFGPRAIRNESVLVTTYGYRFQVGDIGDVPINTFDLAKSIDIIEAFYDEILMQGVKPVSIGGDHTITLPILRALKKIHGPMALVHVDAHSDTNDTMFGELVTHGTLFRRAIEEGLVDVKKMTQIGLRATGYFSDDFDWARNQGVRVIQAEECWNTSLAPVMADVRDRIGTSTPTYLSFDIDGLDPSVAPGTGTPEPAGLTAAQGIEIIRGLFGTNLIGSDLVEVSPQYDTSGNTALLAANLVFEMLCSFPDCVRRN